MMSPLRDTLQYGSVEIPFSTVFADRTTLEIGVDPDGSVLVKAPHGTPYVRVRQRVAQKARWIEKQRRFFGRLPRKSQRQYVGGETHLYLGKRYRLKVETGTRVATRLRGGHIIVQTPDGSPEATARALETWYRQRAKVKLTERLDVSVERMRFAGVQRPEMALRRMATRWGSWTPSGRIHLHPHLVRAPVPCIDYVVTHELCHAVHAHHGSAFYTLLSQAMPDWRERKERLSETDW